MRPALLFILWLTACSDGQLEPPSKTLYLAMRQGDIEQIERHIAAGTDMNQLDKDGLAPIHIAIRDGRIAILELLLRHGVDLEKKDRQGLSPMDYAMLYNEVRMAKILRRAGASFDADRLLMQLVKSNRAARDSIFYLVEQGADINQRNEQGEPLLFMAMRQRNYKLVKYLVAAGADVNARNSQGLSALALAKQLDLPEVVALLQRNGAVD